MKHTSSRFYNFLNALPIAFVERIAPELGRFVVLCGAILLVRVLGGAIRVVNCNNFSLPFPPKGRFHRYTIPIASDIKNIRKCLSSASSGALLQWEKCSYF